MSFEKLQTVILHRIGSGRNLCALLSCPVLKTSARMPNPVLRLLGCLLALSIGACTTAPTRNLQAIAKDSGLTEAVIPSQRFEHRVYRNTGTSLTDRLNVYFEGDGMPWMLRYIVVSDPTPRQPMMLKMMALDRSPALYIGRPCYNGFSKAPRCDSALWTSARYSSEVISSMVEVLQKEIDYRGVKEINLFGHSGGGTIALLVAEHIRQTRNVVTIAGNIDTDSWTDLHGYSPLYTSLNPVARPALSARITQIHLMGGRDKNIPPQLAFDWVSNQPNSYGVVFRDYDHSCCWANSWPGLLQQLRRDSKPLIFPERPFKRPDREILISLLSGAKDNP